MVDELETRDTLSSPWPIFIAFGIALSEVGLLIGFWPLTVGSLLVFVGAVAGILREAGYVTRPARAAGILGVLFVGIGLALVAIDLTGSTVRGRSIIFAGVLSLLAIPLWTVYDQMR